MKARILPPPRKSPARESNEHAAQSGLRLTEEMSRLSEQGAAAFAIDGAQRIIAWNEGCEELLRAPAREVLGKRCYEVVAGRNVNGNLYCHRDCPVARQARADLEEDDPVHPFPLLIRDADGTPRRIQASLFAVRNNGSESASVIHVCRRESEESAARGAENAAVARPALPGAAASSPAMRLSKREWQVLGHLAMGYPSDMIARKLFISPVTVRNHIQTILGELGVHSKLQAVVFAYRNNLVDRTIPEIWPRESTLSKPIPETEDAGEALRPPAEAPGEGERLPIH